MILRSQNQQFFFKDQRVLPNLIYRTPLKSYLGEKSQLIEVLRHTNDSLALVLENKLCLVGDGFVNMLGIFRPPFADYPNELKTTWQKLLSLECDEYYPSHGKKMSLEELSSKITHM